MKSRYYPSQQELTAPDKLERVLRDLYDRIYKIPASVTAPPVTEERVTTMLDARMRAILNASGAYPSSVPSTVVTDFTATSITGTTITGTTIDAGTLTADQFSLNTGVYDDTQQSAIGLRDTGSNVPTLTQIGTTGIWLPQFDVGDLAVFSHQFPHSMAETANVTIHPHVHWIGSTTDATNVVRWQLTYQWVNPVNGVIAVASNSDTADDYGIASTTVLTSFTPITQAGMGISSLFLGKLTRITNGGSDYAGNVFLAFFDLHFVKDTLGSDLEGQKTYPS